MPYHLATPASGLYSTPRIVAGQAATRNFSNAVQFSLMRTILMKTPRWIPAVVMVTAIFAFSSIPGSGMPSFGLFDLLVKKGGHALGYALLALAILHWRRPLWDESPPPLKDLFLAWALTVLYAASDEFHQSFVPGRMASPLDVLIDAIGAFLGLSFYAAWRIFTSQK
jgi:VanZ family protein